MNIVSLLIGGALFFVEICVFAQSDSGLKGDGSDLWRDGVGSGFNPHAYLVGFMAGAGWGTPVLGTKERHDLAVANVNGAWISPELLRRRLLSGNVELRGELFGGGQFDPTDHYLTGFTAMARYDFMTHTRVVPFLDIAAGFSGTDIGQPDLGGIYEFNVQCGAGTYYFLRPGMAVSLEYRWLHFSDAGLTLSNRGTNTQMIEGGMTWFF